MRTERPRQHHQTTAPTVHRGVSRGRGVRGVDDRGDVVGWALVIPLIMMLTLGAVQIAMWMHARSICTAAAQAGLRDATLYNNGADAGTNTDSGVAAAQRYLTSVGDGSVTAAHISETRTANAVTLRCTGHAVRVIPLPGLSITVSQSASAPRERFTTPDNS